MTTASFSWLAFLGLAALASAALLRRARADHGAPCDADDLLVSIYR